MAYTVLPGSNVLPGNLPQNRWYNDLGMLHGKTSSKAVDALLAAFTAGAYQGIGQGRGGQAGLGRSGPAGPSGMGYGSPQGFGVDPQQIGRMGGPATPVTAQTSHGVQIPAEAISGYGQPGGILPPDPTALLKQLQLYDYPQQQELMRQKITKAQADAERANRPDLPMQLYDREGNVVTEVPAGSRPLPANRPSIMEELGIAPRPPQLSGRGARTTPTARDVASAEQGSYRVDALPDAQSLAEGTRATDKKSGRTFIVKNGKWVSR